MKFSHGKSAFTLIHLLVIVAVLAILAALITPAIRNGMLQSQLARSSCGAREFQLATQMMASDYGESHDRGMEWTTVNDPNREPRPATVAEYFAALTNNNYITEKELKSLVGGGCACAGVDDPIAAHSRFKFFWVSEKSPYDQPLLVTANWTPAGLDPHAEPYGARGFIVWNKGGGGTMSRQMAQAASTNLFPSEPKLGYTLQTLK